MIAADSDAGAERLSTSLEQQWVNLRRGTPGLLQPPVDTMDGRWSQAERAGVGHVLAYAVIGGPETVRQRLGALIEMTKADELIVATQIFDHAARLHSYEIVAGIRATLD